MGKIIVAIAMIAEIKPETLIGLQNDHPNLVFIHTGVGKVKATYSVTEAIAQLEHKGEKVDYVLNCGTAGGRGIQTGAVVYSNEFFQKDMNIQALGLPIGVNLNTNYGFNKCEAKEDGNRIITHKDLNLPFQKVLCATSDAFTNDETPTIKEAKISVEEMEGYALAYVCKQKEINFCAIKYVSNGLGKETTSEEQGIEFDRDIKEGNAEASLIKALSTALNVIANNKNNILALERSETKPRVSQQQQQQQQQQSKSVSPATPNVQNVNGLIGLHV